MKKIILAAAVTIGAAGAALAQEAPYTVMDGQIIYPGQSQPYASSMRYTDGDAYYGGASATMPDRYYVERPVGYVVRPGYNEAYDRSGVFLFNGQNINSDQNYNGR